MIYPGVGTIVKVIAVQVTVTLCGLELDKGETAEILGRGTEWLAAYQDML
jgi:hypothetical protein